MGAEIDRSAAKGAAVVDERLMLLDGHLVQGGRGVLEGRLRAGLYEGRMIPWVAAEESPR